jgi:hypothetical protein
VNITQREATSTIFHVVVHKTTGQRNKHDSSRATQQRTKVNARRTADQFSQKNNDVTVDVVAGSCLH